MDTRKLGTQGLEVSAQGLGCMGMSEFYGTTDEGEAIATIHRALELGITFFDTADMVGANGERMLRITLPHVDAWNTWYSPYGNTVDGFAASNAKVTELCEQVGRDPAEVRRSACPRAARTTRAGSRRSCRGPGRDAC